MVLQRYLSNAPHGTVWWDDIALEQIADPGPRKATIASINLRPGPTKSSAESVSKFIETVDGPIDAPACKFGDGFDWAKLAVPISAGDNALGTLVTVRLPAYAEGVPLTPGKTWIELVPNSVKVTVS